jgi:Protein of unknown function (DUF4242)
MPKLQEISRKSVNVLKGMGPEIQWLHSYVTGDKVYRVYLAPGEATIQEHARHAGLPANRVSAVRRLIDVKIVVPHGIISGNRQADGDAGG